MLAIRRGREAVAALLAAVVAVVVAMLVAALTIEVDVAAAVAAATTTTTAAAEATTTTKKGRKANIAHLMLCNRPKLVDAYNCTMSPQCSILTRFSSLLFSSHFACSLFLF